MGNRNTTLLAEDEFYKFKESVEGKGVPNEKLVAAFRASREKFGTDANSAKEQTT
jgi:hypothetical protein